jgi:mannosylglycerate hydrolase
VTSKKWIVHVVAHTHWDREWYLPFQKMRVRLVALVDRLCDAIATARFPGSFTLDGQMVVLEDYWEGGGRCVDQLRRLIEGGNVLVGPWYVLGDEFIPAEESLVRNLLAGLSLSREWGGWMAEGYLPDSFGHPAQMPQILQGFGIRSALFWRGAGREVAESEFVWEAPDGSRVLTVYMPYGYCVAAALPEERDALMARAEKLKKKLAPHASTRHMFFPAGCDHLELQATLGELVSELNDVDPEAHYQLSTVPEVVSALREAVAEEAPVYGGEWRSGEVNYLLVGTLSSRMHLKQRTWHAETLLYRHAEPLACVAMCLGGTDQRQAIELAWKLLLRNHAHDSICGCSVDEVHEEMLGRYIACEQVLTDVVERASHEVGLCLDTASGPDGVPVVVWNSCAFARHEVIELSIPVARRPLREVDQDLGALVDYEPKGALPPTPEGVQVVDAAGDEVPAWLLATEARRGLELFTHRQPELYEHLTCKVRFLADVPPLGFGTFYVRRKEPADAVPSAPGSLENRWVRVEVGDRGTLTITHKPSGRSYDGCHLLVDQGDAGDEYTWSPPPEDEMITTEAAEWEGASEGPWPALVVRYSLLLPRSLSRDRTRRSGSTIRCTIESRLRLWDDAPLLSVESTMENRCKDHLLRVLFPTGAGPPVALAGAPYQLVEREQSCLDDMDGWVDRATASPFQGLVSLGDDRGGLTIAARGVPEYELLPRADGWAIAVTLLRCVGWLSRPDLERRPGDAGWSVPTPGAQCLGHHRWEYAVIPYGSPDQRENSFALARAFATPMLGFTVERGQGPLPGRFSLFELEPSSLVVTSTKPPQRGEGVVLRFFSTSSQDVRAVLRSRLPLKAATKVRLDETPVKKLPINGTKEVPILVGPHEIVTLLLEVAGP